MHSSFSFRRFALTASTAIGLLVPQQALLQIPTEPAVNAHVSDQEITVLLVGEILEIQPVHTLLNPSYSWILTQDRTFIQAGRTEAFRYRFIQPGTYTLIAEIEAGDQSTRMRRTFIFDVRPRMPGQMIDTPIAASGSSMLVSTVPALDGNRVILEENSALVRLLPINPDVRPLALDLNVFADSDGDGIPNNDIDNDGTFFQSDASPLYVWFASPLASQSMTVTALGLTGNAIVQQMDIMSRDYAQQQGFVTNPISVAIQAVDDLQYSFTPTFARPMPASTPLLYHWEFGDGTQSLLANPTHTFTEAGTYTVTLRVRNLADGREVAVHQEQLSVAESTSSTDTGPDEEEPVEEEPADNGPGMLASLGSIMKYIGIFFGALLLGILTIFGIGKLRKRGGSKLSDRLEAMEQTLLKKDEGGKTSAPPLAIATAAVVKPTTPPAAVAKREEERVQTPSPVTPKVEEKNTPSWLRSGLAGTTPPVSSPAPIPSPAAPPPSIPKPVTPPAPPAPKPAASTPAATPPSASVPSWLQQGSKPASPPAAATQPPAKPVMPPAPTPTPVPTPAPAAKPVMPPPPAPAKPVMPPLPAPAPAPKPTTPPPMPANVAAPTATLSIPPPPAAASTAAAAAKPTSAVPPVAMPPVQPPKPATPPLAPFAPKPQQATPPTPAVSAPLPPPPITPPPAPPAPTTPAPAPAVMPSPVPPPPAPPVKKDIQPVPPPPAPPIQKDIQQATPPATPPSDQQIAIIKADSLDQKKEG